MKLILTNSTEVEVEPDQPVDAFDTQGINLKDKKVSFSEAIQTGGTVLKDAIESLQSKLQSNRPKKLELEIGLKFGVEGNVIISKGTAEAAISIKATWGE